MLSIRGAVNADDVLHRRLPGLIPFEEQTAGNHSMEPRRLREATSPAGRLSSAVPLERRYLSIHTSDMAVAWLRALHTCGAPAPIVSRQAHLGCDDLDSLPNGNSMKIMLAIVRSLYEGVSCL